MWRKFEIRIKRTECGFYNFEFREYGFLNLDKFEFANTNTEMNRDGKTVVRHITAQCVRIHIIVAVCTRVCHCLFHTTRKRHKVAVDFTKVVVLSFQQSVLTGTTHDTRVLKPKNL